MLLTGFDTLLQLFNRCGLIPGRLVVTDNFKRSYTTLEVSDRTGHVATVSLAGSRPLTLALWLSTMVMVGLTGGVGSGKSTVATMLAEHGALVIDADAIARDVLAPGAPALQDVHETFGDSVFNADGSLDRAALARVVFTDDTALATLNGITHPRIAQRTAELMAHADPDQVIVHDVPLLVENNLAEGYDMVLVVLADRQTRLDRLSERGMPADEASRRMSAQATDEQRRQVATIVLDNNGSREDLRRQVNDAWARISQLRQSKGHNPSAPGSASPIG
jgi:dephospho-CoA kinase